MINNEKKVDENQIKIGNKEQQKNSQKTKQTKNVTIETTDGRAEQIQNKKSQKRKKRKRKSKSLKIIQQNSKEVVKNKQHSESMEINKKEKKNVDIQQLNKKNEFEANNTKKSHNKSNKQKNNQTDRTQKICGIRVKGLKFESETDFLFWKNNTDFKNSKNNLNVEKSVCLVFGKNATGKSSICKLIAEKHINKDIYVLENNETKATLIDQKNKEFLINDSNINFFVYDNLNINRFFGSDNHSLKTFFNDNKYNEFDRLFNLLYDACLKIKEMRDYDLISLAMLNVVLINEIDGKKNFRRMKYIEEKNKNLVDFYLFKELYMLYVLEVNYNSDKEKWKKRTGEIYVFFNADALKLDYDINRKITENRKKYDLYKTLENNLESFGIFHVNIKNLWNLHNELPNIINDFNNFLRLDDNEEIDKIFLEMRLKQLWNSLVEIKGFHNYELYDKYWFSINDHLTWSHQVDQCVVLFEALLFNIDKKLKWLITKNDSLEKLLKKTVDLNDSSNGLQFVLRNGHNLIFSLSKYYNYIIINNKKQIDLYDLSTGEKNIIFLVYFFNLIINKLKIEIGKIDESDKEQKFFIIAVDDPITSFDDNYKDDICAFISKQLNDIFDIASKTNMIQVKIVIFTHDNFTFNLMSDKIKQNKYIESRTSYLELIDNSLITKTTKGLEYSKLISNAYEYVANDIGDGIGIGNLLRRILEFYLSFLRNSNLSYLKSEKFKQELEENEDAELIKIILSREIGLILNNESHHSSLIECRNENYYKNLVKDVFCLLHFLDKNHIENHLDSKQKKGFDSNIKIWIDELKSNKKLL